ncbi:MAG TPA: MFS transporter, partial [Trichococcus flocculiformis]|nr:MFS transporter [Trichococcus flocculiformis]
MAKNHIIHTAKRPFGFRDILGYFMGDFGCNMSFTLISSYMFIFYTQYIGISLAHYSIIILITKIFDGINDPIIGAIVDRMGADKKGEKFKQWILRGSPFLALAATVIFIDAADWSYAAKLGLCIGGYILWDLTYTVVNVPYGALSSVMTSKPSQRAALSNARSWGYIIAGVPLGILIP